MYMKPLPSQEVLKELFDFADGILTYRSRDREWFSSDRRCETWNSCFVGKPVGHVNKKGYLLVTIQSVTYFVHRIIYKWVTGIDPKGMCVDHKDIEPLNNRIENLQQISHKQNTRKRSENKRAASSAYKGVHWDEATNRWASAIQVDYKTIKLGKYFTELEAHLQYCLAAVRHFGDFANFGEHSPFTRESLQCQSVPEFKKRIPSSNYKGVSYSKSKCKWLSYIIVDRKSVFLGIYAEELEAHRQYCIAALRQFGKCARFGASSPYTHETLPQQDAYRQGNYKQSTSSMYKGVSWLAKQKKWIGQIRHSGSLIYLGLFTDELEAHRQYCLAALKYHGTAADFGKSSPFTRDNLNAQPAA